MDNITLTTLLGIGLVGLSLVGLAAPAIVQRVRIEKRPLRRRAGLREESRK